MATLSGPRENVRLNKYVGYLPKMAPQKQGKRDVYGVVTVVWGMCSNVEGWGSVREWHPPQGILNIEVDHCKCATYIYLVHHFL